MNLSDYRQFQTADLQFCAKLFIDTFSRPPWQDQWKDEDHACRYLRDFIDAPGFIGFVAEQAGLPVAFCIGNLRHWWQGDEFFVQEFFVIPSHQGKGIGQGLMGFTKKTLSERGVNALCLLTSRGSPAERFYRQNGLNEIPGMMFMAGPTKT